MPFIPSFTPWILLVASTPETGALPLPDPTQLINNNVAASGPENGALTVATFLTLLFVLMLATFIGLEVIKNVSRLLHTPLMSLTNAISAIAVVGSILLAGKAAGGPDQPVIITIMGTIALAASMTNIVSGFLITDRMLKMFKKREPAKS